jgi:hypothetical protein
VSAAIGYGLWFLGVFAEAAALLSIFRARAASRYFTFVLYLSACVLVSAGRYFFYWGYGYRSIEYAYFYFLSDGLLSVLLYSCLMGLYSLVFEEMGVSRYLRVGALLLLGATALVTYGVVSSAGRNGSLLGPFVVELSQNLYFVGLVLTYMLWVALMKLRETRMRLIQLISALGLYFSAFAANYALHNFAPGHTRVWSYLPQIMAIALPAAWAWTFARVPEEARLATARVSAVHSK